MRSEAVTAVASELLEVVQTGPETLRWTAVAPALLAALLRGDCLSVLQSAQCTTAVANHCARLLNAKSAAKNSWIDTAVVRAVLGAATGMLAADTEAASGDPHSGVAHARRPFPPPLTLAQPNRDDADRAYDAAIAAVTQPVSRTGLRSSASQEANAAVDGMARAVLSLLRTLHTLGLDCGGAVPVHDSCAHFSRQVSRPRVVSDCRSLGWRDFSRPRPVLWLEFGGH